MVILFWGRSVLVESLLLCVGKVLVESRRHASYSDFFLTWVSCFWCGLTVFAREYDEFDLLRFNGFSRALGVGFKLLRCNSRDKARLSTGVWIFKSISVRFLDSIGEQLPSETSTYFNLYGLISSPRSVRAASFPLWNLVVCAVIAAPTDWRYWRSSSLFLFKLRLFLAAVFAFKDLSFIRS